MTIKTLSEILVEMGETPISTKQNDIPDVLTVENFDKYTTCTVAARPTVGAYSASFYKKRSAKDRQKIAPTRRFAKSNAANLPNPTNAASQAGDAQANDAPLLDYERSSQQTYQKSYKGSRQNRRQTPNHRAKKATHQASIGEDDLQNTANLPDFSDVKDFEQSASLQNLAKSAKLNGVQSANAQDAATLPIDGSDDGKLAGLGKISNTKLLQAIDGIRPESILQNDRATNYMRWLAFYYLSNRELSAHQLREKLLAKGCDAAAVGALVQEFAEKGYQSDERCAYMLIRESVRKARGKQHIKKLLGDAKLALPDTLDELIARADIDSITDGTILQDRTEGGVDWLALAVAARCQKYGNTLPDSQKDKARQLRFLQYRGFELGVCFDALKCTLDDLA